MPPTPELLLAVMFNLRNSYSTTKTPLTPPAQAALGFSLTAGNSKDYSEFSIIHPDLTSLENLKCLLVFALI